MENTEIKNPEVHEKSCFPAPHGIRFAAWLIDFVIVTLIFMMVPQPLYYLLFLAIYVTYHTLLIWLLQQTVGKAVCGLKVEHIGRKLGLFSALGRSTLGYFVVDILGVGVLLALVNRRHRCLHDYVFGTLVTYQGSDAIKAKNLLARVVKFAEDQKKAFEKRKKDFAILGAFWGFLVGLGRTLNKIIDSLTVLGSGTKAPASAPSIAELLSRKAAVAITAGAAAVTGTVIADVPGVGNTIDWLTTPRYFMVQPVTSSFDDGTEGWQVFGDAQGGSVEPTYADGSIMATDDQAGEVWYWQAPKSYNGEMRRLYDRELVFRLKTNKVDNPFDADDVVLKGPDLSLAYNTPQNPGMDWTTYRIRLNESAGWINKATGQPATREELLSVLSDVRDLLIRGEYRSGDDIGWLGEVSFGSKP